MLLAALLLLTGGANIMKVETMDDNETEESESSLKLTSTDNKQNSGLTKNNPEIDDMLSCAFNWIGFMEHPSSCAKYYRCENGTKTLLECKFGEAFDVAKLECSTTATCIDKENADAIDLCQRQADGLYPNYTQSCTSYFRCENSFNVGSQSCPIGQAFSFNRQACQPEHLVTCIQPVCHKNENDIYWLPGSYCRTYYFCDSGTSYIFMCPEGKVFDRETKDCRTGGQCYEPICTGKPDGYHPDTTHDCRRSLHCKGGIIQSVTACPPGHRHNGLTCLPEELIQCEDAASTAVAAESVRDDCNGYSDGPHIIVATNCRRYQICQDGKSLARLQCPKGHIFDGQECIVKGDRQCEDVCEGKPDGFHADHGEGCRKYHHCKNGRVTDRRSCAEGSLFSGRMCLPSPLVNCELSTKPLGNPCLGLQDGFHADYLNGCTDYFYCSGYKVALRTTCLKNTVWNGRHCVHPMDALCAGPESHEACHGLHTGLYQDNASGCQKYYYCHNGNRTLLSCPAGQIFDGEACVNDDEYICPSNEPASCYNKSDGYRMDEESGCRSYYYCSKNDKITYICPDVQLFNGTDCSSSTDFQCPYKSQDCNFKEDGYYPHRQSICRKYFYCHDGSKVTTLDCGPRKVFDGVRCNFAPNPLPVCKMAILQLTSCERSNKPLQDLESQCRRYHYCVGSRRLTATCPEDKIFNGTQCVARDTYICPSDVR